MLALTTSPSYVVAVALAMCSPVAFAAAAPVAVASEPPARPAPPLPPVLAASDRLGLAELFELIKQDSPRFRSL